MLLRNPRCQRFNGSEPHERHVRQVRTALVAALAHALVRRGVVGAGAAPAVREAAGPLRPRVRRIHAHGQLDLGVRGPARELREGQVAPLPARRLVPSLGAAAHQGVALLGAEDLVGQRAEVVPSVLRLRTQGR